MAKAGTNVKAPGSGSGGKKNKASKGTNTKGLSSGGSGGKKNKAVGGTPTKAFGSGGKKKPK
ncbi:MAG: hypothetical protein WBP93_07740 [Pyrinomonadaceae bacterium]